MALSDTLRRVLRALDAKVLKALRARDVKSIHGFAAVVAISVAFSILGVITELQLAIVTLVVGFIALIDTLGDLLVSIERVIQQMDAVNNDTDDSTDQDQARDRDQDQ